MQDLLSFCSVFYKNNNENFYKDIFTYLGPFITIITGLVSGFITYKFTAKQTVKKFKTDYYYNMMNKFAEIDYMTRTENIEITADLKKITSNLLVFFYKTNINHYDLKNHVELLFSASRLGKEWNTKYNNLVKDFVSKIEF